MLYVDHEVELPKELSYFVKKIHGVQYLYHYTEFKRVNGKFHHKEVAIGKAIVDDSTGEPIALMPNDKYFELMKTPAPINAAVKKRGRAPLKESKELSYNELADGSVLGFGYGIACLKIAKDIGLYQILVDTFGDEVTIKLLSIAAYYAKDGGGLTGIEYFTTRQMCFTNTIINDSQACALFSSIKENDTYEFFRKWIKLTTESHLACYDVTSISSYATGLSEVSKGYNRDRENLDQVNFGLFATLDTGIPIYYNIYNGCINDFSNLPYVLANARNLGLSQQLVLVTDGGFATVNTVHNLQEHSQPFLMGAPIAHCKGITKEVIKWRNENESNISDFVNEFDSPLEARVVPYTLGDVQGSLIMYLDPAKEALQKETLKKKILNAQYDVENSQEYSDALARKVKGFYTVTQNDDNSFTYTRNDEAIRTDLMLCGCMALFTTYPNFTASTALRTYNNKDVVEKCFAELKNDILGERLYVHSDEALTGKMFVTFLSLILHKSLQNKLRPWIRKNRSSLDVAFSILSDIECKKCGNQWLLTKVFTSHQKELIKLLQLPVNFLDHK